jgi:heptaprenylglyceryl phosphate synthase
MTLLNSKDIKYRFEEQSKGTPLVKKWGIKPIPTGRELPKPLRKKISCSQ